MNNKITICLDALDQAFRRRKLFIEEPYRCEIKMYFASGSKIKFATTIAYSDGEAGIITHVWGVAFVDPDKVKRCTPVFHSYYNEGMALDKLMKYLMNLINEQS